MKTSIILLIVVSISSLPFLSGQWIKDDYQYRGHRERYSGNCLRHLEASLMRREDANVHIPLCDEHGRYKKRQCHPRDGFCWCVDEFGDMIGDKFRNRRFRCDNVVYNGS